MFLVFCCCLLGVLSLVLVVDIVKDNLAFSLVLCDDYKALGKGLVLELLESLLRSLKRLSIGRCDKVSCKEGFSSDSNLRC
jgi:hypothetical protein